MKGIVTDIQRFSLKDGPGIRTTIFLQGCNMACAWCHNPETIGRKPRLLYYGQNCIRCGKCLEVCPAHALHIEGDAVVTERSKCLECGICAEECFSGARVMSGKEMDLEDVFQEVLSDKDYYRNSGGGVTVSGGEIFMQPEFAYALLKKCKENQIATAIETNLSVNWSQVEKLLPVVDLMMCDIKHLDTKKHKEWTGAGNETILENIQKLAKSKVPMIVRTPVIPGVNQSEEAIGAIAGYIRGVEGNLLYYELLNFNPLGDVKYRGLETENPFYGQRPAEYAEMERLAQAAEKQGISVKIG